MTRVTSRRLLLALLPLLIAVSCAPRESPEARKREGERSQRLAAELEKRFASFPEQTKKAREGLEKEHPGLAKVIPEYKDYYEPLIAGTRQLDQINQLVTARKYGEIAPLALEGFKNSAALATQVLQKGIESLQASIKAIDANRYSEVSLSNRKAEYFKALGNFAIVNEGIFLEVLTIVLLNSPAADRVALFEQAAKTYSQIQRPGAMTTLAQALRTAYKEEDNADNKKRMEASLEQYKIPESTVTPTPTKPV